MKTHSAKSKGRNGQKEVVKQILTYFPHLTTEDVRSTSMGCGGVDIQLSPKAIESVPLAIEVKRRKNMIICRDLEQAQNHANKTGHLNNGNGLQPLLAFREDGDVNKWFACIKLDYLLELLSKR